MLVSSWHSLCAFQGDPIERVAFFFGRGATVRAMIRVLLSALLIGCATPGPADAHDSRPRRDSKR
jgi:hypothetical protein